MFTTFVYNICLLNNDKYALRMVTVSLSVPVQSIARKRLVSKMTYYVSSFTERKTLHTVSLGETTELAQFQNAV